MRYIYVVLAVIINISFVQISYSSSFKVLLEDSEVKKAIMALHGARFQNSTFYPFADKKTLIETATDIINHIKEHSLKKVQGWDSQREVAKVGFLAGNQYISGLQMKRLSNGNAGADVYLLEDDKRVYFAVKVFQKDLLYHGAIEIGNLLLISALFETNQHFRTIHFRIPKIIQVTAHVQDLTDTSEIVQVSYIMEGAVGYHIGEHYLRALKAKRLLDFGYPWQSTALILGSFHSTWRLKKSSSSGNLTTNERNHSYAFYIREHTDAFKNLYTDKTLKNVIKTNLESLRQANVIKETYYKNIKRCFTSVHQQFNTDNRSLEALDALNYLTLTHGDLHLENILLQARAPFEPPILTFIDNGTMLKTYNLIGDPAEDIGRFIGSLWVYIAKQCSRNQDLPTVFQQALMWQENFILAYLSVCPLGERFETLLRHNVDFFKLRYFKVVLSNNNRPAEYINFKSNLLYFVYSEFMLKKPDLMTRRQGRWL